MCLYHKAVKFGTGQSLAMLCSVKVTARMGKTIAATAMFMTKSVADCLPSERGHLWTQRWYRVWTMELHLPLPIHIGYRKIRTNTTYVLWNAGICPIASKV